MRVMIPLTMNPQKPEDIEVMHLVDVDTNPDACAICGASRFSRKMYYTTDAAYCNLYARHKEVFGMWSPKHEAITAFRSCAPHPRPEPPQADFFISAGEGVLQ